MTSDEAPLTVDARGMRCPWPALRLARAMREAADVLLIADDPQAEREARALADANGWRIESGGQGRWRVRRIASGE